MNRVIHQIWGLCARDAGKEPPLNLRKCSESWQGHPGFEYRRWDRPSIESLLDSTPWRETFDQLPHWVEQCDFARYVIVYIFGGIYADMDTICKTVPVAKKSELLVGIEASVSRQDKHVYGLAREYQLCQWTFAADAKHPALLAVILAIVYRSSKMCITDTTTSTIMNTTGPGIFTDAIVDYMKGSPSSPNSVTILDVSAFGCGQPHSRSPSCDDDSCMVSHTFEGSWKVHPLLSALRPMINFLKRL